MSQRDQRTPHIPLDQRDPTTVRAVIYARSSDLGSKPKDMTSQIERCKEFIAEMGWPSVPDHHIFTEAQTAMRNVARPVMDQVLELAAQHRIDVIVCSEWARVHRLNGWRYKIVKTAEEFGVEFRFEAFKETRGKLDEKDPAAIIMRGVYEALDEIDRNKIVERLSPMKIRRYIDGLPHGGSTGPLYGYKEGTRTVGKHGRPAGMLTWDIDEDEAKWVRWLFNIVDTTPAQDLSYGNLARYLQAHDAPTPKRGGLWGRTQIKHLLTNPKYCGLGRNLRYVVDWKPENEPDGKVRENKHVIDRMKDEAAWDSETYATTGIPPLVKPEVFQRVQVKLHEVAKLHNRGGARRADSELSRTLLNGGFIRCAECGDRMTRYWSSRANYVYYQCNKKGIAPNHPHRTHNINAKAADMFALRLLAKALTDPEMILELADAAEQKYNAAAVTTALAAADIAVTRQRIAELDKAIDKVMQAIQALSAVAGMEDEVANLRKRAAPLRAEREQESASLAQGGSHHDKMAERQAFLREMFTTRKWIIDFTPGSTRGIREGEPYLIRTGEPYLQIGQGSSRRGPNGERIRYGQLTLPEAAALLSVAADALDLPIIPGETHQQEIGPGEYAEVLDPATGEMVWEQTAPGEYGDVTEPDTVLTEDVIYLLLEQKTREELRGLLARLDATVLVTRPRPKSEGRTFVEERVALRLMGTLVVRVVDEGPGAVTSGGGGMRALYQ
jgi:DNA invertase Pin-like site-specific DNA recombinase